MSTRRTFLQQAAIAAGGIAVGRPASARDIGAPVSAIRAQASRGAANSRPAADLSRPPDTVGVQTPTGDRRLVSTPDGNWTDGDIRVEVVPGAGGVSIQLSSPSTPIRRVRVRWNVRMDDVVSILGDAWERAYGDLEWRAFVPDRVMPWYFATTDGRLTHTYGVRTGARALCFWQADPSGITLWADVRSGGVAVELGARTLAVCDVIVRGGRAGESSFAAIRAACGQMCVKPRLPSQPVYGSNDWYWAYGKNSAVTAMTDARRIVDLSPTGANRPFAVIDDGWQPERGQPKGAVGMWDRGNEKFPDMPALAGDIRRAGARPGIWIRPLLAPGDTRDSWRLARDRAILDPTVPEVRQKIAEDIARIRGWGYDLIKHDYSSFDIFGRWGSTMGEALTRDGWTFAEGPRRTTAEVIGELYGTIRAAAGDGVIIGCNTVSHLSAGVFDICRIGDDTSGRDWARTRKMGLNTLAFRGAQHGAFYTADADCVGVTAAIPWRENRQWLDLLARSGTMLFVSLAPDAVGPDESRDLRAALALAAAPQPLGEPLDWQQTAWPSRWRLMGREVTYDWLD